MDPNNRLLALTTIAQMCVDSQPSDPERDISFDEFVVFFSSAQTNSPLGKRKFDSKPNSPRIAPRRQTSALPATIVTSHTRHSKRVATAASAVQHGWFLADRHGAQLPLVNNSPVAVLRKGGAINGAKKRHRLIYIDYRGDGRKAVKAVQCAVIRLAVNGVVCESDIPFFVARPGYLKLNLTDEANGADTPCELQITMKSGEEFSFSFFIHWEERNRRRSKYFPNENPLD